MSTPGTYENIKPVSLAAKFNYRRGSYTQDSYVRNGYMEGEADGPYAIKRPGLRVMIDFAAGTGYTPPLGVPMTLFTFQGGLALGNGIVYFMIGGRQFYITPGGGPTVTVTEVAISGAGFGPNELFQAAVTAAGGVCWQGNLGIYRSGSAIINVGASLLPSLCQLDQTFYVLTVGGIIRASALGDITTWPALNTVTAFGSTNGVHLTRHLQYLVAFSTQEMKIYYDAGISPGAPIAQETSFVSQVGLPFAAVLTVQESQDVLYWLGISTADVLGVYMMPGLQMQKISTPEVDRFLADNFTPYIRDNGTSQGQANSPRGIRAMIVESGGHSFYVLTCPTGTVPGTTLAYDITTKVWYLWDQSVGGTVAEVLGVRNFGMAGNGLSFIPGYDNGKIYVLDANYYQDATAQINFEVQTTTYNWGNSRTKLIPATYVNSDTLNSSFQLSWADDDYATYSTPQTISTVNSKKQLIRCGSTIGRAWKITHTDNTPMRVFGLEVEVQPGAL